MKKLLILLTTFISLSAFGQNDSANYWSYARKIVESGTDEIKGIKADDNGNLYYTSRAAYINPGNLHALVVGKIGDTLNTIWKKRYYGYLTEGLHQILVDENNIYISGNFNISLAFTKDTFTTGAGYPETFLLCLDNKNGDVKWVRNIGRKEREGVKLNFDGNKDLILAYSSIKGPQTYDGQVLDTVNNPNYYTRGYAYLTLNKTDGTLKNHCFGEYNILANQTINPLFGRKVYSLTFFAMSQLGVRVLDLNTNKVVTSPNTLFVFSRYNQHKVTNTLYHPKDKSWTLFINYGAEEWVKIGQDTLKKPKITNVYSFYSAVKLDSNLKMLDYITYNNVILGNDAQLANDTTLVFSMGADGDGYIFKNGVIDTIRFKGGVSTYQKGYFIAKCNLNFQNFSFNRFSVRDDNAGWQTGMDLQGIDLNTKGNVFAAVFHENDIIALPYFFKAGNQSWKHISVIAKYGNAATYPNSLDEIATNKTLIIYPNPVSDILHISSKEKIKTVVIFDSNGKNILSKNTSQIDVSGLKPGIYFISIETETLKRTTKFLKQ